MLAFVWLFTGVNTLMYAQVVTAGIKLAAGVTLKVGVGRSAASADGLAENGWTRCRHIGGGGDLAAEELVLGRKWVLS